MFTVLFERTSQCTFFKINTCICEYQSVTSLEYQSIVFIFVAVILISSMSFSINISLKSTGEKFTYEAASYYNSSSICLFVCSPTPPRSFDGSSPNFVGVCRWTSELSLRGSFLKSSTGQRVKGHFFGASEQTLYYMIADDTRLRPSERHTASKSLIPSTGTLY